MTRPVFYAPELTASGAVTLPASEAKHVDVMRLGEGDELDVVDGAGLRVTCRIAGELERLATATDPAPAHPITLVQALAKGGRDERAVEAAIAVGTSSVIPWGARRSIAKWSGKQAKARSGWQKVALAAMKQSRQSRLAHIAEHATSRELTELIANTDDLVIVLDAQADLTLREALAGLSGAKEPGSGRQAGRGIWLIVGPEGGITDEEMTEFSRAGAVGARLGPSILRAGTAGPIACALACEIAGNWDEDKR